MSARTLSISGVDTIVLQHIAQYLSSILHHNAISIILGGFGSGVAGQKSRDCSLSKVPLLVFLLVTECATRYSECD